MLAQHTHVSSRLCDHFFFLFNTHHSLPENEPFKFHMKACSRSASVAVENGSQTTRTPIFLFVFASPHREK